MARSSASARGVTYSVPPRGWAWLLVVAATQFWLGVSSLTDGRTGPWFDRLFLCVGCACVAQALRLARLRVSVTPDAVTVRGLRRRTIAWEDVRAFEERRSWLDGPVLQIVPTTGKPITALVRAPGSDDTFEWGRRDLERRWRARTRSEADRLPVEPPTV